MNIRAVWVAMVLLPIAFTSTSYRSFGSSEEYFALQAPRVLETEGSMLNEYNLRVHNLSVQIILKSMTNEYRDYVVVTEIRMLPEGTTAFIFTIPEKTDIGEEEYLMMPWKPDEAGKFQVRVFLISDFENPQVLSLLQVSETTIYDDSFKGLVKLSKSACDGFCPSYHVEVYQNRTSVFEGYQYIADPGRHVFEATQDQMEKITHAINESNFFSDHEFSGRGIEGVSVTMIEINLDGKWNRVHFSGDDIPKDLAELEHKLKAILDTKKWVGR